MRRQGFERIAQHGLQRQIVRANPLDADRGDFGDARGRQDDRRDVGGAAPPAPRVAAALDAQKLSADFRGSVLRLSFHAYSGVGDVERTVAALT